MGATRNRTASMSRTLRGTCVSGRLAPSLVLALAMSALATVAVLPASALAVAAPIALDAPDNGESPLIAYDPSTQTTYVAWADPHLPGVDLCVLQAGSSGCEGGAPVILEDSKYEGYSELNHPGLGGLVVLSGGEAVVIGTPVSTGSVAWASAPGGAAFLSGEHGLQNGGKFISPVSLYRAFGNAVALSATDVGLLDDYEDFFSDSPLTAESPAIASSNSNPGGQYQRKSLFTDGPEVAAEPAPAPAAAGTDVVVGVGSNESSADLTPPGCLNYAATGYGVSAGKVSGASKSAGTLNNEGLPAYQLLACSAEAPVLAQGGQDGIGVLEEEGSGVSGAGSDFQLDYHPFVATATGGSFGAPVELADVTGEVLDGVDALDLSEDSGTGVYALWEDGRTVIDFSGNGGANWGGPVVSPIPYTANGVIAGVGGGFAEVAYDYNPGTGTQVFLQPVNYQELATPVPTPTTLTTTQASGSSTGASISIPAGTIGETDRATLAGTNAATATGTVTYGLFSSSSCAAATKVFAGGTSAVSAGVAAPSAPVTAALATGTYYWEAAYSGDAHNDASVSACGSEVLTVTAATTIGGGASSTGTSITITITCEVVPCTVTVTITITESGKAAAARKKHHTKTITLATGKFTITSKGTHKLTVHLTKAGKHYLSAHHGRGSAKLLLSDRTNGATFLTTRTIEITPAKHKHKK
jgi:hypothetical protein